MSTTIERIEAYEQGVGHGYTVAILEIHRMIDKLSPRDPQFEQLLELVEHLHKRQVDAVAEAMRD